MSKKMLAGVLLLLLSGTAASAGEPSRVRSEVKTEFDQACLGALGHLPSHYGEVGSEPFSEMAIALIKRCNANPNRMTCDVTSKTTVREYGQTPFACGVDTVYTGPAILLPDTR